VEGNRVDRICNHFLEPADSTLGKLQLFCPTFFNSLSILERHSLSSSTWLKKSITKLSAPLVEVSKVPHISAQIGRLVTSPPSSLLFSSPLEKVTPPVVLLAKEDPVIGVFSSSETSSPHETYYSQELTQPLQASQHSPPGYREPKEDASTLSAVLDLFIPFLHGSEAYVPLPTFLGKKPIDPGVERGQANTSSVPATEGGKEFSWSRGLGIELSPIKTRSARKKSSFDLKVDPAPILPTDGKALRELKALARTK